MCGVHIHDIERSRGTPRLQKPGYKPLNTRAKWSHGISDSFVFWSKIDCLNQQPCDFDIVFPEKHQKLPCRLWSKWAPRQNLNPLGHYFDLIWQALWWCEHERPERERRLDNGLIFEIQNSQWTHKLFYNWNLPAMLYIVYHKYMLWGIRIFYMQMT